MNKNQHGFVLIVALIFFQILFLLGWYAITMNLIKIKQNRLGWQYYVLENFTQRILVSTERKIEEINPQCHITQIGDIATKPIQWWQAFSHCRGDFHAIKYYYLVESLGEDPCATVDDSGREVSADYFRVNVLALLNNEAVSIRLQSTYIKPHVGATLGCHTTTHRVTIGRQMWRSLI